MANNFGFVEDNNFGFVEDIHPEQVAPDLVSFDDIINNNSLTKEQKKQAIIARGQQTRKQYDKELNNYINKQRAGLALELGSALIPYSAGAKLVSKIAQPALRTLASGVPSLLASGGLYGVGDAVQNGGGIKTVLNDMASSVALGKGAQALAKGGKVVLNSPVVTKALPKIQELTTSVPAEYSERAIQKELAGDSIFKGKFDQKDLNKNYYEAGQKAVSGIQALEMDANKAIHDATVGLNDLPLINRTKLVEKLASDIDSFRHGGDRNPAIDQKGKEIMEYLNQVASDKTNSALAGTKGNIQALVSGKYGKETGEGIMALKGMGHTINEELRNLSPDYALANDARANLYAIKDNLGGLNHKTVASRLRNAEGDSAIRSGYNQSAEELDSLVAPEFKFLDQVKDLRAREALESWFPGQYGGFGGAQGGANAGRLLAGGFGVGVTRNPAVLGFFSPKVFGQGTIRGIGALNNFNKYIEKGYDNLFQPYTNTNNYLFKELLNND